MTEEAVKKKIPYVIVGSGFFYFANRLSYVFSLTPPTNIFTRILLVIQNLSKYFIGLPSFHTIDLIVGIGALSIVMLIVVMKPNGKNFRPGEEHGSAEWGSTKDIEPFLAKNKRNRILLSDTESIMINEEPEHPKNQRNRNILVVGGSGSGKTRFIVKPNLMQMNSSFVITDPKGEVLRDTGKMFMDNGYKVKVFNIVDLTKSLSYNPFAYINSEADILKFVDFFMANTSDPSKSGGDEFWTHAEKLLYMAYIGLMFEAGKDDEFTFNTLIRFVSASHVNEEDESQQNVMDQLFEEHGDEFPESFAYSQYKKFKLAAGKTAKSILISAGVRLAPFDIKQVKDITNKDELDLRKIGDEKTVFYLVISDTSATFNFLAGILYSQMFNILIEHADNQPSGRLNIPVQFYLDEFANTGKIPNFERLIATIRSRAISTMIILQSKAQLKSTYKDSSDTIIGNCDSEIFLGGREGSTLKELSEHLGKETIDVLNRNLSYGQHKSWSDSNTLSGRELMTTSELSVLDNSKSIVQIRGVKPFLSKKIELTKHPNYPLLSDNVNDGKLFDFNQYVTEYRNSQLHPVAEDRDFKFRNAEGKLEVYEDVSKNPNKHSFTKVKQDKKTHLVVKDIDKNQKVKIFNRKKNK